MFEAFLKQHDAAAWARTCDALSLSIHEVDRNATHIWFHFYPLNLAKAFTETDDAERLARELRLNGNCRLSEYCDTSHWFLYGHRYWPHVKAAVIKRAESTTAISSLELAGIIREIAKQVAGVAGADEALLLGITAVGVMTLQQVGLPAFRAGSGTALTARPSKRTPAQIVAARKKDDSQGLAGLFRGIRSQYTVTFDERRADGRFMIINRQHLTTAAANDKRDYSSPECGPRVCVDGPIPVECRTASCGTCWVGILGGAEKLSDVDDLEARRIKEFGYINSAERKPIIRLACMAAASGNVSIVIPPWNGFIGRKGLGAAR